ncbi:MAG: hypothetical protein DRI69_11355 [Bacteroidetes bacterium]|nr:MAG: hypothetical protein DRI69_11355 [Bacteroidota bacterium]
MIHYPSLDAYGEQIDPDTFEPMKITFEMRSPIVTTDYIFLDGLISSAVFKDCIPNHYDLPQDTSELIYIPLPLKQYGTEEPFYAASIGYADQIVEGIDHWRKRTEIETTKKKIQVGSGQYKMYDIPMPTMWAESWVFYANGNIAECTRLLQLHISAIGKKCSQGFGQIKNITVEASEHDWGVVKEGVPMRPIPVSEADGFDMDCDVEMYYAYRPPYWHRLNMTQCYMPLCRV